MANEGRVTLNVYAKKGNFHYQNHPTSFRFDIDGDGKGPVPGAVTIDTVTTDIDLSELVLPGQVVITSLEDTDGELVEWGVHDQAANKFHPVGELLPGQSCTFRFSRNFGVEEDEAGTGTTAILNSFAMRARNAPVNVKFEAMEA